MAGRDQFTPHGEAWTREDFLDCLEPAADRSLAVRLFDLNDGISASYCWLGSRPGGAIFVHPGGLKYSPLRVLAKDGVLIGQGTWTTYRDVRNHEGFAEMARYLGQDHEAAPSRFFVTDFELDELWGITLRCASEVNEAALEEPISGSPRSLEFDDRFLQLINEAVNVGQVITTLGKARPNRITSMDRSGLWVETEKSVREGKGPQLVPAWMITTAWRHLREHGRLSQARLLNDLNVKRSAFVCALLAHFPGVDVAEDGNIVLRAARRARDDAEPSELSWPTVRESSDPLARPYTATGRAGKVNVRHFRQPMTHAMDVEGLVWSFFPSREEAEAHVQNKVAEGHDSIVVPAKPYIPTERPLPRPTGDAVVRPVSSGAEHASWPGGQNYAAKLNRLFDTVRSADGNRYTSAEVAEALQADGLAVHSDSIDRLREGSAGRPSEGLSFALAFFFDVDPDYFVDEVDRVREELTADDIADLVPVCGEDLRLSQAQFVRVLAGIAQATSRCLEMEPVNNSLANQLALIICDTGPLMLEAMSGEVVVPATLAARIMTMWAETDPAGNGTESDYQWAAHIFSGSGR